MKKVLIFGTFDMIHPGHLFVFKQARELGEVHACLALDETVKKVKGGSPHFSLEQRIENLKKHNVQGHSGDPVDRLTVLKNLKPDIVMLGYDQKVFVDTLEAYKESGEQKFEIIRMPAYRTTLFSSRKIRAVVEERNARFILVDKPVGEGSMRTVIVLRKLLNMKRVGFAGTLDPIASGLLVCGTGRATALLDWWHLFPKKYEVEAKLGVTSDTYDSEAEQRPVSDIKPSEKLIGGAIANFVGKVEQVPPMYSAKKVKGERLYVMAREGKTIDRKKQTIQIHSAELLAYTYPTVRLRVTCSTGTYIRSLVHELGTSLGTGAIMTALRRTAIGPYYVADAPQLGDLNSGNVKKYAIDFEKLRDDVAKQLFPEST